MYCSKCNSLIVQGGKFCSECGTKIEKLCPSCNTKLSDIAKFCHICGAKVLGEQPVKEQLAKEHEVIVSTKRNRMLYIDDVGLFYIAAGNQLCFVGIGQDKIKKLTNKSYEVNLEGLGYCNGELFYWYSKNLNDESELRAINIHTFEKRKVKKFTGLDIEHKGVIVFRKDRYILINDSEQSIWEVSVPDGNVLKKTLPILRHQDLPPDWQEFFEYGEKIKFNTFVAVNDYGYASVATAHQCTIRFRLDDPNDYICMPMSLCTANPNYGFIIEHNEVIYSCASECCYPNHFYVTRILNNNAITKILFEREKWLHKTSCNSMRSWWKMGDKYILGSIVLDMANNKILVKKMSESWERATNEIIDFVEDDNGNVYLLEYYGDVYALPKSDEFYGQEPAKYLIKYN